MYKELMCLERDMTDKRIAESVEAARTHKLDGIVVLPSMLVAAIAKADGLPIGVAVDYPFGASYPEVRLFQTKLAIRDGAKFVVLTINHKKLIERQFSLIAKDISDNVSVCKDKGVTLRVFLEYKLFDNQLITDLCQNLRTLGVDTVYPATGSMVDTVTDNLVISRHIQKQKLNVISNPRILAIEQLKRLEDSKIYGATLYSDKVVNNIFAAGV